MGYQVGQTCYPDALSAVKAMAANEVGSLVPLGQNLFTVDSTQQSANSITWTLRQVNPTNVFASQETVTPIPCEMLDTGDGLIIAWGIATAWIVTAAILFLRRGIQT